MLRVKFASKHESCRVLHQVIAKIIVKSNNLKLISALTDCVLCHKNINHNHNFKYCRRVSAMEEKLWNAWKGSGAVGDVETAYTTSSP